MVHNYSIIPLDSLGTHAFNNTLIRKTWILNQLSDISIKHFSVLVTRKLNIRKEYLELDDYWKLFFWNICVHVVLL